jgi:chromosome partitioning protein
MGKIIVFGNQKGGVGKTTLTAMAATALAQAPFKRSVFVADVDRQQSLIRRRLGDIQEENTIPPYPLEYKTIKQLLNEIESLDNNYDLIFIDAPGKLDMDLPAEEQEISKVLLLADFVFIPVVPGNYAMDATIDFLKIALKVKANRPNRDLQIIGLVNMAEPRTLDDKFLLEEIDELKGIMTFMENRLHRYVSFRAADTLESLYDAKTTDRAKQNFSTWLNEFIKLIES